MSDQESHHSTGKLKEIKLRVTKADSSFVYFTFESNEGLAFYSTLEHSIDENHRDLVVRCTPEFSEELMSEIRHLQKKMPVEILSESFIDDR